MDEWKPVLTIGNLAVYQDRPEIDFVAVMERDNAPMYYMGYENNNTMHFSHFFTVNQVIWYHGLNKLIPALMRPPETMKNYNEPYRFGEPLPVATVYLTNQLHQQIDQRLERVVKDASYRKSWPYNRLSQPKRPMIADWMRFWMNEAMKEQDYPPVIRLQMDFVPKNSSMILWAENRKRAGAWT